MSKITDRIRDLLALSNSSNPHEAALAASMARDLMERHGIEAATLSDADESPVERREGGAVGEISRRLAQKVSRCTSARVMQRSLPSRRRLASRSTTPRVAHTSTATPTAQVVRLAPASA